MARSMADFSITGQELAAITPEVLAAPWKLFASPSAAQRAESRRVEEARVFAQAATEYRRALSGIQKAQQASNSSRLQKFCQLLLDYVSAGHFEVYYELIREAEAFDDGTAGLARPLMPQITATTQIALDFNDTYAEYKSIGEPGVLAKALSELGETLATRFDLEDQLIAALHACHREQVA